MNIKTIARDWWRRLCCFVRNRECGDCKSTQKKYMYGISRKGKKDMINYRITIELQKAHFLTWRLKPTDNDPFALVVVNTTDVAVGRIEKLLSYVVESPCGHKKVFSNEAATAFRKWLGDPTQPLPSQAYARLSNWFLTDKEPERSSPRAYAAGVMWMEMFHCEPENRLTDTDPKPNWIVLPERFDPWWQEQQKRQEECR